jgi:hypothetical protein
MHFKLFLISAATMVNAAHGNTGANENLVNEPINLGKAGNYAILAKAGITNDGSTITGDIAVSPIAGTSMTGFNLPLTSPNGFKESLSSGLYQKFYAPEYAPETAVELTTAVSDMLIAYNNAAGHAVTPIDPTNDGYSYINHGSTPGELGGEITLSSQLGGLTLTPGVYEFGVDVKITNGDLTFDGAGVVDPVFIIKTTKNVVLAANKEVKLLNGALAENIFWQVAETVEVGAGAKMVGTLLVWTSVKFNANSQLEGRILAGTAVTLDQTTITDPTYTVPTRRGLRGLQVA